ncbi:methyl-accepting chemotaxis protein [Chromobacterium phragmitis]|uniref:Methyl-accepting chemotaxis protein n=1 Tax=Chromobacterium phragmitis TaxID=2202141 RepID=A0ABV0IVY5_9NEIS
MGNLSIKWQMVLLACCSLAASLIVGIVGYFNTGHLSNTIGQLLEGQSSVRRQMDADMMHDAIHADVLAMLLAVKEADAKRQPPLQKDNQEHNQRFLKAMRENQAQYPSGEVNRKLTEILPIIQRYTESAAFILANAFSHPAEAEQRLSPFLRDFETLEDMMEKVSDAIEQESKRQNDQAMSQVDNAAVLTVAVALLSALLLAILCYWVGVSLLRPVQALHKTAQAAHRDGNLSLRVGIRQSNEIGTAIAAFDRLLDSLHNVVGTVGSTSESLGGSVRQITEVVDKVEQNASLQNASANTVSQSISELTDQLVSASSEADATLRIAAEVGHFSLKGNQAMQETVENIRRLADTVSQSAQEIGELTANIRQINGMVDTIRDIADQTNLLALNAAIEAARAGETGRGFAVVADEVRALAERTTLATGEIVGVIDKLHASADLVTASMQDSVSRVEQGVSLASQAGSMVNQIGEQARSAEQRIHDISRILEEQRNSGQSIVETVQQVSSLAGTTCHSVGEVQQELERLTLHFQSLDQSIQHMRV